MSVPTAKGGYGAVAPPPRRGRAGEWCLDKILYVCIMAVFIVYLMPYQIAPSLGVTPEAYQSQIWMWTIAAGLLAMPFAWFTSKILAYMIKS
jgi:hypothetical protein